MKKITLILCIFNYILLVGISLQEAYEQAYSNGEYEKYLSLETGQIYEGGLLIGKVFDPISQQLQGNEGLDVKIEGNGAILDLQGQQIAISYVHNRLDIENCVILNGNVRYRGDNGLMVQESPYGEIKYVTFYKPHDYAIRLQGSGKNINIEKNIVVDTQNTGWDYLAYNGQIAEWLPTGNCIAISVVKEWYGVPNIKENWTFFEDEEENSDTLRHYVALCEYGCVEPQAVSWAASQNFSGQDPKLLDPENGDYRVKPGSAAEDYGCQTFSGETKWERNNYSYYNSNLSQKKDLIEVQGKLSQNTFWSADTVNVVGNVYIEPEVELQIAAGTKIIFQDYYEISVGGCINATGTAEKPILFTSANPELFNLEYDTLGSWNGLHFWETSSSNKSSELKYCIFEYAKAIPEENYPHPECGGAISLYNFSKLLVQNCIFRYNIASYGGSLSCSFFSNPQISNNLFHNNYAWKKGSAIFISNSYPTLNSNTITANVDLNTDIYSSTASVFNFLSKTKFYNNIVYNNTTNYFEQLSLYQAKAFYTEFNNFKNSEMGGTNLSIPPQFIAPEDNNYALNIDSECIDSGSNNMPAVYAQLDLSGNPRIVGTNLDIGAYEYFTTHNLQEEIYSPPIKLSQNFPNPFIPHLYQSGTKIKYSIRNISKDAFINIYNTKGQLIKKIPINSKQGFIIWDGTDSNSQKVVSGLYLYELSSQNYKVVKKMILLR